MSDEEPQEQDELTEQDAEAEGSSEVLPALVTEVMPAVDTRVQEEASLRAVAPTSVGGPLSLPTERELRDLMNFSKLLFASGMFPDLKGAAQAAVKIVAGRSFGLDPIQSQGAFCMVQGRLTQYAKFQGAIIKRSGRFDYTVVEATDKRCELEFHEKDGARGPGWQAVGRASFTIEEAAKAGLGRSASGRSGAWQMFPKAMLFARALTQGVTWFCPHLMLGSEFNKGFNNDLAAWGKVEE